MKHNDFIIDLISESLGVVKEEITSDSDFYKDFNSTRLELIDLILKIEKQFKISLDDEKKREIQTVGQLLRLVGDCIDEF